jgi:predicted 3-demethylubiquinone-9 3-methyltransferase (glyoxalase superfamily)
MFDGFAEEAMRFYIALFPSSGRRARPVDNYGFSRKFGWVTHRYGVSWQLNLK